MKRLSVLFLASFVATGCASSTVIRSKPSGATVTDEYGQVVGKTPYRHEDTEMWKHQERFSLKAPGYKETPVVIKKSEMNTARTVGFAIGGFVIPLVWAGLLWSTEYPEEYSVELKRGAGQASPASSSR